MMRERVALYEALSSSVLSHHATQTFVCAMVLTQVKALGLVRAFNPQTTVPNNGIKIGHQ